MYFYPSNLKGQDTLFFWTLKDVPIIIIGVVLSVIIMVVNG